MIASCWHLHVVLLFDMFFVTISHVLFFKKLSLGDLIPKINLQNSDSEEAVTDFEMTFTGDLFKIVGQNNGLFSVSVSKKKKNWRWFGDGPLKHSHEQSRAVLALLCLFFPHWFLPFQRIMPSFQTLTCYQMANF